MAARASFTQTDTEGGWTRGDLLPLYAASRKGPPDKFLNATDMERNILQDFLARNDTPHNITVMMSGDDLVEFADILIRRAKAEALAESSERERQEYLRGEEVQKLCKVCASTLVKWKAKGYLVPVAVGGKNLWRKSDVMRMLESRGEM